MKGYLHSIQTMGLLDGPGVRTVFFLQGCPLKCLYCHNPDSQKYNNGEQIDIETILKISKRYRSYHGKHGGITFSGGEPLLQGEFLLESLKQLKYHGYNTCVDTSGYGNPKYFHDILKYTDTVLLDIKEFSANGYLSIAGKDDRILKKLITAINNVSVDVVIRHVMMPGYTDNKSSMDKLVNYIYPILDNVKRIEILPFHKMGEEKYTRLNMNYTLSNVPEMNQVRASGFEWYANNLLRKLKRIDIMKNTSPSFTQVDYWMEESQLFKNLTKDQRDEIAKLIEFREMNRGELIFKSFDKGEKLFMVCSGKIKIYENTLTGKEQIIYIYSENEFVGGLNLIRKTDYLYNGECIEPGVIGVISKEVFDTYLVNNPNVLLRILNMSFERIRLAEDLIRRLTNGNTDAKVASLLLKLWNEFGETKDGEISLILHMTREELGSMVGITRETLTRKLTEFKDRNIIDLISTKQILILDMDKLKELSEK